MKIQSIENMGAFWRPSDRIPDDLPQVAFAGRSNVGKSSLINMICGNRKVAKTSTTPGKTIKIQFFKINGNFYLVDLPGYGYARQSKELRLIWRSQVEHYLESSRLLRGVVNLIDIRHVLLDSDRQMLSFLASKDIPTLIALTKTDKLGSNDRRKNTQILLRELGDAISPDQVILTSAFKGDGCEELLEAVAQLVASEPPPAGAAETDQS
jgi:GTP-binding protein